MLLDAAFVPDAGYASWLSGLGPRLASVHFALNLAPLSDARQPLPGPGTKELARLLAPLACKKYGLANARFHLPDQTLDRENLRAALAKLERMRDEQALDGLVLADMYMLRALSDASPETCSGLEALPSVNARLDSPGAVRAMARVLEQSAFAPPSLLVLDRSLNRDLPALEQTAQEARRLLPGIKIGLLANEGCLAHCPFKPTHDAHIALSNTGLVAEQTFALNRSFGCVELLAENPHQVLASPFIRPEDQCRYAGLADVIKVCGRTRGGVPFLKQAVSAYAEGRFEGNLLSLLDAVADMEDRWEIRNRDLPEDFFDRVARCGQMCGGCTWCREVFDRVARQKDAGPGGMPA